MPYTNNKKRNKRIFLVKVAFAALILGSLLLLSFIYFLRRISTLERQITETNQDQTRIESVRVDPLRCQLLIDTSIKQSAVLPEVCSHENNYRYPFVISQSKEYLAFEDLSGGVDSKIQIYSVKMDEAYTLNVYGASILFDFIFLPGDYFMVINGYSGIPDEQWVTVYDIGYLFSKITKDDNPSNLLVTGVTDDVSVALPPNHDDVSSLLFVKDAVEVRGVNGVIIKYSLKDLTVFAETVSKFEAESIVSALPEVKDYYKRVSNHTTVVQEDSSDENAWLVQVFEMKNNHTATFNWYHVNKKTGEVTKEFNF